MQEMRNPRGEVSGACTDTLNCHPGDVESFARTWSRIPHNICISFPDTWAQFVRRGSARQTVPGKGTARGTAGSEGGEGHWDGHCAGIQCGTRNGNAFTLAATGCIITLIL